MRELDGGGLRVFENEKNPEPMGVALWKDDEGNAHAIIGKKLENQVSILININ